MTLGWEGRGEPAALRLPAVCLGASQRVSRAPPKPAVHAVHASTLGDREPVPVRSDRIGRVPRPVVAMRRIHPEVRSAVT
jgi:hypothetical protein